MSVKSEFLRLLEQNKGRPISGEAVASELNCSRAAVNKAAIKLREEGYSIDAGRNRGYMLSPGSNVLSSEGLKLYLQDPNLRLIFLPETDSTNLRAREAAQQGTPGETIIVVSRRQTLGRGRRGRSFYSPEGGIYMSILLRPDVDLAAGTLLTITSAAAICKAVEEVCGIRLSLKWVNDLYLNGLKVGGILTEAVTDFESGNIEYAIVGIGLNVFWEESSIPEDLREVAGAIFTDRPSFERININALAASIVDHVIRDSGDFSVPPLYIERNIVPGHNIIVNEGQKKTKAFALSVEPDGRLKIREESGDIRLLSYGDISIEKV